MKTVLPSRWAFLLFTLYLFASVTAGAILYDPVVGDTIADLLSWVLPLELNISSGMLSVVAATLLVPLGLSPILSYRYAVKQFDNYALP